MEIIKVDLSTLEILDQSVITNDKKNTEKLVELSELLLGGLDEYSNIHYFFTEVTKQELKLFPNINDYRGEHLNFGTLNLQPKFSLKTGEVNFFPLYNISAGNVGNKSNGFVMLHDLNYEWEFTLEEALEEAKKLQIAGKGKDQIIEPSDPSLKKSKVKKSKSIEFIIDIDGTGEYSDGDESDGNELFEGTINIANDEFTSWDSFDSGEVAEAVVDAVIEYFELDAEDTDLYDSIRGELLEHDVYFLDTSTTVLRYDRTGKLLKAKVEI
jgi:hypothetical protein